MANSSDTTNVKNKVINELLQDELFFNAIDSSTITSFDESDLLLNRHVFRYNQNPETMNNPRTFITVMTNSEKVNGYNKEWMVLRLEIWIYSHMQKMVVDNIPNVSDNRNDYIGRIIDEKFNGRTDFGYGQLDCISNTEGSFTKDYLYRRLIFETKTINNSMCGDDDVN